MTQENHSSKRVEDNKEIEALKKKAENLQKLLDMTRKTIDHDKSMLNRPRGHDHFGRYEMT